MPGITCHTGRATQVEALHLITLRDLHVADLRLRGHGVESAHRHPALAKRGLLVPAGPSGIFTIAKLGHWLVRDLTVGRCQVIHGRRRVPAAARPSTLTALADAVT